MSEDLCPWCGCKKSSDGRFRECGSWQNKGCEPNQVPDCRVNQLEAQIAPLRAKARAAANAWRDLRTFIDHAWINRAIEDIDDLESKPEASDESK